MDAGCPSDATSGAVTSVFCILTPWYVVQASFFYLWGMPFCSVTYCRQAQCGREIRFCKHHEWWEAVSEEKSRSVPEFGANFPVVSFLPGKFPSHCGNSMSHLQKIIFLARKAWKLFQMAVAKVSEPPHLGSAEGGHPDLFRFPRFLPICSALRSLFSGMPWLFRFALISSDLFSEQIRTNQNPFCPPLWRVPESGLSEFIKLRASTLKVFRKVLPGMNVGQAQPSRDFESGISTENANVAPALAFDVCQSPIQNVPILCSRERERPLSKILTRK